MHGDKRLQKRDYHILQYKLNEARTAVALPDGHEFPFAIKSPEERPQSHRYWAPSGRRFLRSSWFPVADAVLLWASQHPNYQRQWSMDGWELEQRFLGAGVMELRTVGTHWNGHHYVDDVRISLSWVPIFSMETENMILFLLKEHDADKTCFTSYSRKDT